ncbi:MAG TPA: ABC transporter permease [Burkholderiales bacterium]|nr:ABC transporter permease [Burkholderiales bacterium]
MAFAGEYIFRPRSWRRLARFAGFATVALVSPSTYGQAARELAVRHVHAAAWQILPGYTLFSALLSLVLIEIVNTSARKYGVSQYALELVLRVLVLELLPLLTALFVALRTGAAIASEVALMKVGGELEERAEGDAGSLREELVPRVAGAALSVFSLTTLSCAIACALTYFIFYGTSRSALEGFTRVVGNVFDGPVLVGFVLKCLLFGLAVALIPIATGLEAERGQLDSAPSAVLGGLVKLFFVIGVIEIASLVVKYV